MANGDDRYADEFFKLIMAGKWGVVHANCRKYPDNIYLPLTKTWDNVIHLAVSRGETDWLEKLLDIPAKEPNELRRNKEGDTPLNLAAMRGDLVMCEKLCWNGKLAALTFRNNRGEAPMYLASVMGAMDAFNFLLGKFMELYSVPVPLVSWDQMSSIQREKCNDACIQNDMDTILHAAIRGEFMDLAYKIFQQFQYLAIIKNNEGETPIHLLAKLPTLFRSGYRPGIFKRLFYYCIPENLAWKERLETLVPEVATRIQTNVSALNEISESSQTENEARIPNDVPALSEIPESTQTTNEASNNQMFREQATSMGIISWFRRAQYCVVGFLCPKSVIKEKRKHLLSRNMVERTIQYLKQQPEIDQSNPWTTRSENAAPNPSEETVANSNTSEEADTSSASEETVANSSTSEEAGTSNALEESVDVNSSTSEESVTNNTSEEAGTASITSGNTVSNSNTSEEASTSNSSEETDDVSSNASEENVTNDINTNIDAPIVSAVKMGITEMVGMIVESFPFTVEEFDRNGKNLVFVAAESRQPQVLQLLMKLNIRQTFVTERLKDGKNVLHVAAELQEDHHPWSIISGAPLQMHLEAKWFELVKALMPSHLQLYKNNDGKKPNEVYEKSHEKLVGEGLEWLSSTARSCTAISSLLTTAALATAATVPGGVDPHGVPNLRDNWRFKVFSISALTTLCFGVLSLVLFLVILSSRSDVKNFKKGLPRKLIYGLTTLCISLSTLLLAFCSAQSFAMHGRVSYAAYASYAMLPLSIIYLVIEQLPLFVDFIEITSAKLQDRSNS